MTGRISAEPISVILFSIKKILKDFSWCKAAKDFDLEEFKIFMFLYSIDHYSRFSKTINSLGPEKITFETQTTVTLWIKK